MKTVMSSFSFFLPAPDLNRKRMPRPNKILPILLICLLAPAGCPMESQEPVGETPASINPQEWEGTWVSNNKEVDTRVLQSFNPTQGILIMKIKKWNEKKKQEETETSWLYLRQSGNWLFASWREVGTSTFFWGGRIENLAMKDGGRVIVFWLPDFEKIPRLIARGELPGRLVEGKAGNQMMGPLLPKHYQVMRDNEQEIFFRSEPFVLVRPAKQ